MEKIYLVESEVICDCELIRGTKSAFKSGIKARLQYEAEVNEIKSKYKREDWLENEKPSHQPNESYYESYENGYFVQNHATALITELHLNV
jgi:hypothetical protein